MSDTISRMPGVRPTYPVKPAKPVQKDGEGDGRSNDSGLSRKSDEDEGTTDTATDERTNTIDEYI